MLCSTRCTRCSRSLSTSPRSTSRSASASSAITSPPSSWRSSRATSSARGSCSTNGAALRAWCARARRSSASRSRRRCSLPTATCSACCCGTCCCPGRAARSCTAWRRSSPRAGRALVPSAVSRQHRGPGLARAGGLGGGADHGQHRAAAVIKALAFDVFGTVVDWRGAVIREGELLAKNKGLRVDWPRFADAWRAGYHPAMDRVRKGKLPWTRIDQLHRMILNDLLKPFGLGGLMMVAAHPRDLEAAQRAGLKTAYVPRPLEYGLDGRQETGPHAVFDVTAGDFLDLAVKLGA